MNTFRFQIGLYDVGRKLGKGTYATVRWARHKISKTKVCLTKTCPSWLARDYNRVVKCEMSHTNVLSSNLMSVFTNLNFFVFCF